MITVQQEEGESSNNYKLSSLRGVGVKKNVFTIYSILSLFYVLQFLEMKCSYWTLLHNTSGEIKYIKGRRLSYNNKIILMYLKYSNFINLN